MTKKPKILILLLFCFTYSAGAQIRIIPLAEDGKHKSKALKSASLQALTLPFWEDFSTPGRPDTLSWQNSEDVFVNAGLSYDPPSLYVASFDGLDVNGDPYAPGSAEGPADSLTSRPFNLSGYIPSDNIYLSFFYQYAGLGDQPEPRDSLDLQFRKRDSTWVSVWPASAADLDRTGEFRQVLLAVTSEDWLHENFQMRFQSYGRLSGSFDLWNIDYIYMNSGRSPLDTSYPDRAISEPLTGFLDPYRRIPYAHLRQEFVTMPSFRLRNLVISVNNQNKAYNYYFNYEIHVVDTLDNVMTFTNSTFVEPLESPIPSNSSEEVIIREPFPDFAGNPAADSAHIRLEVILDAEDNVPIGEGGDYDPVKYSPIDFQTNDTLRNEFILSDSYAYDDGTAELGAGLNTAGDRLAYQYALMGVEDAVITGMEIYFPFTGTSPDGKQLELTVWDDDAGFPGNVIYRQLVNARQSEGKNIPVRYEFDRPVLIGTRFYIGYRQNSPGPLAIGLDVNSPSSDKMFFNLGELWENNTLVQGSLMLRPVFSEVDETITGIEEDISSRLLPYPNPVSDGTFYLNSAATVTITDLRGREVGFERTFDGNRSMIRMHSPASGIYLVHAEGQTWKLIIP